MLSSSFSFTSSFGNVSFLTSVVFKGGKFPAENLVVVFVFRLDSVDNVAVVLVMSLLPRMGFVVGTLFGWDVCFGVEAVGVVEVTVNVVSLDIALLVVVSGVTASVIISVFVGFSVCLVVEKVFKDFVIGFVVVVVVVEVGGFVFVVCIFVAAVAFISGAITPIVDGIFPTVVSTFSLEVVVEVKTSVLSVVVVVVVMSCSLVLGSVCGVVVIFVTSSVVVV